MTASDQAIDEAAAVYAAILDDPQRAVEIRAARERYAAELAAQTAESRTCSGGEVRGSAPRVVHTQRGSARQSGPVGVPPSPAGPVLATGT